MSNKAIKRYFDMTDPPLLVKEFSNQDCALKSPQCNGRLGLDHRGTTVRGVLCKYHNTLVGFFERALPIETQLKAYLNGELTTFITSPKLLKKENCSYPNCNEKVLAKNLCSNHYKLQRDKRLQQIYSGPTLKNNVIPNDLTCPLPSDDPSIPATEPTNDCLRSQN
jgi:hypothetical protein